MWNKNKSVKLTHFMVRSFYFVTIAVFILPLFRKSILELKYFIIPLYLSLPLGLIALVCLDKLLCNIKKNIIFDNKNVKLLRVLSWVCFAAGAVALISFICIIIDSMIKSGNSWEFLVTAVIYIAFPIMGIGELFVALIVRVVKNSFEKAIELKNENDLTI